MKELEKYLTRAKMELKALKKELEAAPKGRLVKRGTRYTHVLGEKEVGITNDE